ncbi:uncharacterized protein EI97DRAFT_499757 [Westerdykella ornata]|uniref:Uncharacterized protein n=1 Tax=Westerdykella ornata TaxID=318751 RepID=A0A6A6JQV3_WESOR|nr:uncharacterized protein EI97DRAFT_499757 [Westerdykella ornata]KAF2278278.1 hypothetical protein EI97DRAFT_499757 [Westerdykella ornata]
MTALSQSQPQPQDPSSSSSPAPSSHPPHLHAIPLNDQPIELPTTEPTPAKPVKQIGIGIVSPNLGEAEDIDKEFLGEKDDVGVGRVLREKRKVLLESRSRDPGVIVDLPREPTAEEVLAARSAEGAVTPALGGGGGEEEVKG